MATFQNKSTHLTFTKDSNLYSMKCEENELINHLDGSPHSIAQHCYKLLVETLQSMYMNNCSQINVTLSWN